FVAMTTQGCLIIGLRHAIHHSSVHGSSGSVVHATGPTVTEKRSVGTFTNLNVASAFEVDVVVGGATSVSVEAPKAAMSH
ncbi:hypothetical protein, partial [Klebsiella pneumoniae]|uniref:hypothetical protein n=1 Tax=Klebsiella pneumoniae TaxID=573 RepID=UPI003EE08D70